MRLFSRFVPSPRDNFQLLWLWLAVAVTVISSSPSHASSSAPSFTLGDGSFLLDRVPFRVVSGDIHYWRSLPEDWSARLQMAQMAGLNSITTYIHWAKHMPQDDGQFIITPLNDFRQFLDLASDLGLFVIMRVGPYITAEVDFGGFPYWLQHREGIQLRRPNGPYYQAVDDFFDQLIPLLVPYQYNGFGGPIINFQVEDDTDLTLLTPEDTRAYYTYLVDGLRKRSITALINTLAFPTDVSLTAAVLPGQEGVWTALEFGMETNISDAAIILQQYSPTSPFMVCDVRGSCWLCSASIPVLLDESHETFTHLSLPTSCVATLPW
jgi:beta-galactosidase